jgi:hypothetical protein
MIDWIGRELPPWEPHFQELLEVEVVDAPYGVEVQLRVHEVAGEE